VAAGRGLLDYDYYLALLGKIGFTGPLILHSLEESDVPGCVAMLREKLGKKG
jgi:sugar phosphate isomerase/epimerase